MLLGIVIYTLRRHRFPLMDKQSTHFMLLWAGLAFVNSDETVTVTQSITAQKRQQNQIINIHSSFLASVSYWVKLGLYSFGSDICT